MYDSIVELRESRNTEFKAAQGRYIVDILPTSLAKYACAFANGEGRTLYLGICDDGKCACAFANGEGGTLYQKT